MHDVRIRLVWLAIAAVFWSLQLLYVLLPIDILPDLIPLIGWTDDVAVVLAGLGLTGYGLWRHWPTDETPRLDDAAVAYEPLSADEIRTM